MCQMCPPAKAFMYAQITLAIRLPTCSHIWAVYGFCACFAYIIYLLYTFVCVFVCSIEGMCLVFFVRVCECVSITLAFKQCFPLSSSPPHSRAMTEQCLFLSLLLCVELCPGPQKTPTTDVEEDRRLLNRAKITAKNA